VKTVTIRRAQFKKSAVSGSAGLVSPVAAGTHRRSHQGAGQELLEAMGDNIEEQEAPDDALYALRALVSCYRADNGVPSAVQHSHEMNNLRRVKLQAMAGGVTAP
jgi:hypothetical protein